MQFFFCLAHLLLSPSYSKGTIFPAKAIAWIDKRLLNRRSIRNFTNETERFQLQTGSDYYFSSFALWVTFSFKVSKAGNFLRTLEGRAKFICTSQPSLREAFTQSSKAGCAKSSVVLNTVNQ